MNKKGHSTTLVPAHPGTRNAVKAGVYSPATLAPMVHERYVEISTRPALEVLVDRLGWEVAGLSTVIEAMDRSIEEDGVLGRRGEPRTIVSHRLRANEKLRQTLEQYAKSAAELDRSDGFTRDSHVDEVLETLVERIARWHSRESIASLAPSDVDPEYVLEAFVTTEDPAVSVDDRLRARTLLTRRKERGSEHCVCYRTARPRDAVEFRQWIEDLRDVEVEAHEDDSYVASVVRQFAAGAPPEPEGNYRRTREAYNEVVEAELRRARNQSPEGQVDGNPGASDQALTPFWELLLSADAQVTAKQRLKAFAALEDAGAFHECTCHREKLYLRDDVVDTYLAFTIRLISGRHYRAAAHRVQFPETFLALREAVDARLLAPAVGSEAG